VICHCATSKRLCQSRNSCAVSDPGLVVEMDKPKPPCRLMNNGTLFVIHDGTAQVEDRFHTVDPFPLGVELFEIAVPGIFDLSCQTRKGPVPGFLFPFIAVWGTVEGL